MLDLVARNQPATNWNCIFGFHPPAVEWSSLCLPMSDNNLLYLSLSPRPPCLLKCLANVHAADSPRFYKVIGLSEHAFDYNIASSSILIVGVLMTLLLVDIAGRRPILLWGALLQAIFIFIMAAIGGIGRPTTAQANTGGQCCLVQLLQFKVNFILATMRTNDRANRIML